MFNFTKGWGPSLLSMDLPLKRDEYAKDHRGRTVSVRRCDSCICGDPGGDTEFFIGHPPGTGDPAAAFFFGGSEQRHLAGRCRRPFLPAMALSEAWVLLKALSV